MITTYRTIESYNRRVLKGLKKQCLEGKHNTNESILSALRYHTLVGRACKKQIPLHFKMEPVYASGLSGGIDDEYFICGRCELKISGNYCENCGQKIDWGVE